MRWKKSVYAPLSKSVDFGCVLSFLLQLVFWRAFGSIWKTFGTYCSQNDNNGREQQQCLQQQSLWEYVSDVYSGSVKRTYAPGQGNAQTSSNHFRSQFSRRAFLLLLVMRFFVFNNFCVLCSWPAAVWASRRPSGRLSGRLGV